MKVSKLVHKTTPQDLPRSVCEPNVHKRFSKAETQKTGLTTGNTLRALFPVLSGEALLDILMTGSWTHGTAELFIDLRLVSTEV